MIQNIQEFLNDIKHKFEDESFQVSDFSSIAHFPLNSKQCIYIMDWPTGRITYKRNIYKILGYDDDEFNIDMLLNIAHSDDLKIIKRITQAVVNHLTSHTKFSYEDTSLILIYRFRKKDGTYIKILRQSTLFEKSSNGMLKSNLSILTDISFADTDDYVSWEFLAPQIEEENFRKEVYREFSNLFTRREVTIIELIAEKYTTKDIAEKLFISEHTVNTHRKNILKKGNCHNAGQLIAFCKKVGVL
ncbi:MAG: hypothetical protein CMC07_09130 [Flavobacteriaceae bacterium]|jgi:DNA-binding CsgD family transcriptional regulator|nr:hypothetical protein [Flavobacteriaceae bacterium]HBY67833.1 hypothetical protein [Flavobacteriaceae bacterium]|tara:strand:- start:91902 stop:92636 length:735 start_codon:yes stop_codon:yes gene_type:complete